MNPSPMILVGARKVFFETFGCQMNVLDTELMIGALQVAGYEVTAHLDDADLIVYNTCSVRLQAENKVMSRLGQIRSLKAARPDLVIAVVGCMAQKDGAALKKSAPHVDLVVGPGEIDHLPSLVRRVESRSDESLVATEFKPVQFQRDVTLRPSRYQAYVSVIRGCDVYCTFCIVPYTRGREVSRRPEQITEEVRRLAEDGCREVTLLGQTVDHYGKEFRREGVHLGTLLESVSGIDGIERVRFVTSHPKYLSDDILRSVGDIEEVCEYLHMPVQSGSDRVLRSMRRRYDTGQYLERVARARELVPNVRIASDFIVGFPGETEEDFLKTADLMERVEFSQAFIFKYSPRPGTPAADMEDDVPLEEKKRRNQHLLKLQDRFQRKRNESMRGEVVEVLVEGVSRRDPAKWTGRTRGNEIVVFDRVEKNSSIEGSRVQLRIVDSTALTLFGEALS
ncbi:MAG: tRNA (N6-isopentenyl adenosine(37)-C2)-methylthiotransferase MiaB [Planctomycetota bacterium]|nr:tRNA (N6-isopentenyl adenosine(37)-C2)-methylthiotransferase MiaB [Planctomycetota bacterium]